MESTTWVLSPNTNQTTAGNTPTPGKSPYYASQDYTPTGGVQSSNPASGSGSNSMQFGPPSQQPTPQAMHHVATPSNFTDSEQMFLHQFEQNLYEEAQQQGHHLSNGESPRNTPGAYPDNIPQTHHHSGSTPGHSHPTSIPIPPPQYEFGLDQMTFIIPDDMSFDENHHNNHIPHQGSSSAYPPQQPQQPTPSMMPANKRESDSMFSPVLPGQNERSYNNQHYFHRQNSSNKIFTQSSQPQPQQQQQQHVRPDAVFTPLVSPAGTPLEKPYRAPVQASFEPLTSPALNAQPSFSTTNSTTSTVTAGSSTTATSTSTTDKRKYEDSGSASTYKRRTPHGTPILAANNKSSYSPPASKPRNGMSLPESAIKEETSMLPPVGGKPMLNTNSSSNSLNNGSAPLMGFTMGRLAEEQGKPPQTTQRRTSSMSRKSSTSSSDSASSSKKEKPATKKASHKLAEQGRRNRMNMAVHELGSLIPQSYHDEVSIPSKATTVELASKYITALLKELEELKQNK